MYDRGYMAEYYIVVFEVEDTRTGTRDWQANLNGRDGVRAKSALTTHAIGETVEAALTTIGRKLDEQIATQRGFVAKYREHRATKRSQDQTA